VKVASDIYMLAPALPEITFYGAFPAPVSAFAFVSPIGWPL
jgi:hypothetical protein